MKSTNTITSQCMGAYSSAMAADVCALQAADLFAYEITHEFENRLKRPHFDMRWGLRKLLSKEENQALIKFIDSQEMLEILMNSNLIDECQEVRLASSITQLERKMDMSDRWSK